MSIRKEKKHNKACFTRRIDAYFAGPEDSIAEVCNRCNAFYESYRIPTTNRKVA